MKIVVNKCFGGFSLSPLAIREVAKRKGKKAYFFDFSSAIISNEYTPLTFKQACKKQLFVIAFSVPNPNHYLKTKKWSDMSTKERDKHIKLHDKLSLPTRPDDRTDKDLIAVVEKLGDKASGSCAELKIVEIPDGVDWEIDEYDGIESIHEKHRSR